MRIRPHLCPLDLPAILFKRDRLELETGDAMRRVVLFALLSLVRIAEGPCGRRRQGAIVI
jgi:hypothetical protein